MKAATDNNYADSRLSDVLSLRDTAVASATRRVPPGEAASRLPLLLALTVPPNNVDDPVIDGRNPNHHWSSLRLLGSPLLPNSPHSSTLQRPPRSLSNVSQRRVNDEARRRKLVSILQEAIRIIDEGATDGLQSEDV